RFDRCDLSGADLQATDLTGARFARCKLDEVEFSQAVLSGADLRTSTIERMRVGITELHGAIVDPFQASYLAGIMGLVIKNDGE
ncbi:MAG TPA: pentapeptide repeat-containing protein, partial [Caldilinea sp.]|nr:pentapeptide repeat-containing protein [Caldilinea sp.]